MSSCCNLANLKQVIFKECKEDKSSGHNAKPGGPGTFTGESETCFGASSLKGDTWGAGGMILEGEISHDKAMQWRDLSNTCEISWGV